jgi:ABC-type antimicrobial peptide transport system permease subunit
MALGADRRRVIISVLRCAFAMVGAGIVLGLAGSAMADKLIRGLLYEVNAGSPMLLIGASLTMLLVGTLAALGPALRACAIDPLQVIRSE